MREEVTEEIQRVKHERRNKNVLRRENLLTAHETTFTG